MTFIFTPSIDILASFIEIVNTFKQIFRIIKMLTQFIVAEIVEKVLLSVT